MAAIFFALMYTREAIAHYEWVESTTPRDTQKPDEPFNLDNWLFKDGHAYYLADMRQLSDQSKIPLHAHPYLQRDEMQITMSQARPDDPSGLSAHHKYMLRSWNDEDYEDYKEPRALGEDGYDAQEEYEDGDDDDDEYEDEYYPDADDDDQEGDYWERQDIRGIAERMAAAERFRPAGPPPDAEVEQVDILPDPDADMLAEGGEWEGGWHGVLESRSTLVVSRLTPVAGIVGPVALLLQNVMLALVFTGGAICLLVAVPTVMGKLSMTVNLHGWIIVELIATARFLCNLAKPMLDVATEIVVDVLSQPYHTAASVIRTITGSLLGTRMSSSLYHFGARLGLNPVTTFQSTVNQITPIATAIDNSMAQAAASDSTWSRAMCMLFGYLSVAGMVDLVAKTRDYNPLSARIVAELTQHSAFAKIIWFMTIEMILFPIWAGMVIHYNFSPIFGNGFRTQWSDFIQSPVRTIFLDLMVGTWWVSPGYLY